MPVLTDRNRIPLTHPRPARLFPDPSRPQWRSRGRRPHLLVAGLVAGLAAGLAALSACTAGPPPPPPPAETTAPPPEPATFATASTDTFEPDLLAKMAALGIVTSTETRTDAYGTWNPLTLAPDAPVLTIPDGIIAPEVNRTNWAPSILDRVWPTLATFLVSDWLDSELVWDDTPENRATVTDRLTESWLAMRRDDGQAMGFESLATGELPWGDSFFYGSPALDQDFNRWRQTGVLQPGPKSPSWSADPAYGARRQSLFVAAEPRPYVLGQPRTFVTRFELVSIKGTELENSPQYADFTVSFTYYRPLVVPGAAVTIYECNSWTITIRALTGWPSLIEYRSINVSRRDSAIIDGAQLAALPSLTDAVPATPSTGSRQTLGAVSFALPASAVADDAACPQFGPGFGDAVEHHVFRLDPASPIMPGCLQAVAYPGSEPDAWWFLNPGTTTWSFDVGPLRGGIDVTAASYGDDIAIEFQDPGGLDYHLQATVPTGTGRDVAAALAASITYDAPTPTPGTTSAVTETP